MAYQNSQQTQDVDSMLVQCWPSVCNAGPASNQHCFNASYLLIAADLVVLTTRGDYKPTQIQFLLKVGPASPWLASSHSALVTSQYFMLVGARAHLAMRTAANSDMEVSSYFTSVHVTVFWKSCNRHCCRQQFGSICLFDKSAYYHILEGL